MNLEKRTVMLGSGAFGILVPFAGRAAVLEYGFLAGARIILVCGIAVSIVGAILGWRSALTQVARDQSRKNVR